jgi:hypothetical protein
MILPQLGALAGDVSVMSRLTKLTRVDFPRNAGSCRERVCKLSLSVSLSLSLSHTHTHTHSFTPFACTCVCVCVCVCGWELPGAVSRHLATSPSFEQFCRLLHVWTLQNSLWRLGNDAQGHRDYKSPKLQPQTLWQSSRGNPQIS